MPDNQTITEKRPPKRSVSSVRPYAWLHEKEPGSDGAIRKVNTVFLSNKECSFKCVMCDLWKDTLDSSTPAGAIPKQIRFALDRLPGADMVKLYNNGNFFDKKAIPRSDFPEIARILDPFETVLVENHPRLCTKAVPEFQKRIKGSLEVAMGVETIHPHVLPRLNKLLTTADVEKAAEFLQSSGIKMRAFLLLNPPFLTDTRENIDWCLRSVEFAFKNGIQTCSIIPTRAGNGIMDQLQAEGTFVPPTLRALEIVFKEALLMNKGRIFADTWDLEKFSDCDFCLPARKARLEKMNMLQKPLPQIQCAHCGHNA